MVAYKNITFILALAAVFLYGMPSAFAQATEQQARNMLEQRGIPEDTLRARLLKKGYNPDAITPDQLGSFQTVILETIGEIEKDRNALVPPVKEEQPAVQKRDTLPAQVPGKMKRTHQDSLDSLKLVPLQVYGQEIFRNASFPVYQRTDEIAATDDYVLGAGDRIGIIAYGKSQFEKSIDISPDGFIQPDTRLPRILLKGVRLGEARELLFKRFSQYFSISRGEFQVTLLRPRNMTVNVYGEVKTPGAFSLPGTHSAFNVISAAGGPTLAGSVRRIRIIRGQETIPVDVYAFMNDPVVARNYFLQHNDIVHIPVAQKVVNIRGAIVRPMKYELLDDENLERLIRYAGGASANAFLSGIQITRYLDDRKIITNVNLRELLASGGDYVLLNGDEIEIKAVGDRTDNIVKIKGAIDFPGEYERHDGMRVSNLIRQGVLQPGARLDYAYLLRYQPDETYRYERLHITDILAQPGSAHDVLLADNDEVFVMALSTYVAPPHFVVGGAVNAPDTFTFNPGDNMKLDDALLLAGGLSISAAETGYVIRQDPREPKTAGYIYFNLAEIMENPASPGNIEIQNGDHILVFDKIDRRDTVTVSVFGAIRHPGKILYGPGMRLSDVISLTGGFTLEADYNRIDIARVDFGKGKSLRVSQYTTSIPVDFETRHGEDQSLLIMPYDHIYVRTIPDFELPQTVSVMGEVKYPGTYPLVKDKERIYDVITRAGGLTGQAFPEGAKLYRDGDSTGLVVIDLHDIMRSNTTPSNIVLINGDVIQIPKSRELVTIEGHVNLDDAYSSGFLTGRKSISIAFRGDKSAKYYVDKFAAGVSTEGSPGKIKVQYADGRVQKTRKFFFTNTYPRVQKGSTITVGPKDIKPQREKPEKKTEWASVMRDIMAQATAVLTLLILVDQLSK